MKAEWRVLLFMLVLLTRLMRTSCLVPVLYPAASETTALVFDGGTRALLPAQGSFSLFLCNADANNEAASFPLEPCSQDIVIYTRQRELDLIFSVVDEDGFPIALNPEPEYQVDDALAEISVIPDSAVDSPQPITNEISTIRVTLLQKETPAVLTATWAGFSRNVSMFYDTDPPRVNFGGIAKRRTTAIFDLDFRESVVVTQDITCDADMPALDSDTGVLDVLASSQSCNLDLAAKDWRTVVNVTGADTWTIEQDHVAGTAVVTAFVIDGQDANVTIVIPNAGLMDFSGNRIGGGVGEFTNGTAGGNKTFTLKFVFLPPLGSGDNETAADAVGRAATAAVVTTMAASAVTAIGTSVSTSMTAPVIGSAAGGSSGSALAGGLEMLNMGQKVYFTSLVASSHLPENYKVMASNLKWTALNAQLPWKSSDSEDDVKATATNQEDDSRESNRKLLQAPIPDGLEDGSENPLDRIEDVQEFLFTTDPRETARRVFFWVAVLFGGLVSIHLFILLLLHCMQRAIPKIFAFPRLELYACEWAVPAIAAASGSLMTGDTGDVILGAAIFIFIPGVYLAWYFHMLWRHFYKPEPHERGANLVVATKRRGYPSKGRENYADSSSEAVDAKSMANGAGMSSSLALLPAAGVSNASHNGAKLQDDQRGASPAGKGDAEPAEGEQLEAMKEEDSLVFGDSKPMQTTVAGTGTGSSRRFFSKYLVKPTLGPKLEKVTWVSTHSSHARFVERFGPMFEDYRGHVVVHRSDLSTGNSKNVRQADPKSVLNPLPQKPLFMFPSVRRKGPAATVPFYKHYIQTAMGALLLAKLVFFAVLLHGEDEKDNLPQLIVLVVTSTVFFFLIRSTQPFVRRLDMAVALLAEFADIIVFTLAIVLFSATMQTDNRRKNIGITMICFEALAFFALFVEKMFIVVEHVGPGLARARQYIAQKVGCCCGGSQGDAPPGGAEQHVVEAS
ncbi:unnamed protein product [Ostreobium quekettii]|uniref:Uncharacterized protein n=1 Tax=Ostreobium quekettii TaxID=121088 RepID=A0A8S1JEB8_9CHLO|nr:unnamed protein product [Ostreobium quekettii]|eukprot:evm.model.scf_542.3 EVM.evm.TU.scf_542.3   scf_542:25615-35122(+)